MITRRNFVRGVAGCFTGLFLGTSLAKEKLVPDTGYKNPHNYILNSAKQIKSYCLMYLNMNLTDDEATRIQNLWSQEVTDIEQLIVGDVNNNETRLLAIYAILVGLTTRNYKLVITASSFRFCKVIYKHMEDIADNCLIGGPMGEFAWLKNYMFRKTDSCGVNFELWQSKVTLMPIGTTFKVRGMRANMVLGYGVGLCRESFSDIVSGFAIQNAYPFSLKGKKELKGILKNNTNIRQLTITSTNGVT